MKRTSRTVAVSVSATVLALLTACGGGGGGSTSTDGGGTAAATGNVALLVSDAPTDVYEEINLTITNIRLLPDEEASGVAAVTLFEGKRTLDLLQLRDYSELLSVSEEVPVEDYARVRLTASRVELVDTDTNPETVTRATLPSGRIDLVPQEPLRVAEDRTLYLELDVDAERSVLTEKTDSGRTFFRPVVFVDTLDDADGSGDGGTGGSADPDDGAADDSADKDTPLLSVKGELRSSDDAGLLACPSPQAADLACVRVIVGDDTGVYDGSGNPIAVAELTEGDSILALGLLRRGGDEGRRELQAFSVTRGSPPEVGTRGGTAAGPANGDGEFRLRNGRIIALAGGAAVVDNEGERVGVSAIQDGQGMTIHGIVDAEPLIATLVILRGDDDDDDPEEDNGDDAEAGATTLRGELVSVDTDSTLQVAVDGGTRSVRLVEGGTVVISGSGRVSESALQDLDASQRVRIIARGQPGASYFEAEQIVAVTLGGADRVIADDNVLEDDDSERGDDQEKEEDEGDDDGGGPPEEAGPPDGEGPPGRS